MNVITPKRIDCFVDFSGNKRISFVYEISGKEYHHDVTNYNLGDYVRRIGKVEDERYPVKKGGMGSKKFALFLLLSIFSNKDIKEILQHRFFVKGGCNPTRVEIESLLKKFFNI